MPISKYTKRELEEDYREKRRRLEEIYNERIRELTQELNESNKTNRRLDQKISELVNDIKCKDKRLNELTDAFQKLDIQYTMLKNEKKGKIVEENKLLNAENVILKKIIEQNVKNYRFDKLTLLQKIKLVLF